MLCSQLKLHNRALMCAHFNCSARDAPELPTSKVPFHTSHSAPTDAPQDPEAAAVGREHRQARVRCAELVVERTQAHSLQYIY